MNVKDNDQILNKKELESCNDCGKCCQFGSGFLIDEDKQKIAVHLDIDVNKLEKKYLETVNMFGTDVWRPKFEKPFGPCIFYNKKKHCEIHSVKPLLCKLANCKEDITKEFYKKYIVDWNNEEAKSQWKLREEIKNNDITHNGARRKK